MIHKLIRLLALLLLTSPQYLLADISAIFDCPNVKGAVERNEFEVKRPLEQYLYFLQASFGEYLGHVLKGKIWIDVGAGQARAAIAYRTAKFISEYLKPENDQKIELPNIEERASVIALGITKPNFAELDIAIGNKLLTYIEEPIEVYAKEHPAQADLVTDMFGSTLYSTRFDLALEALLRVTKTNGKVYFLFFHHIYDAQGQPIAFEDFMKMCRGFSLIPGRKLKSVELVRNGDEIFIPKLKRIGGGEIGGCSFWHHHSYACLL